MFTVVLTAYTATSMALAISADQTVVAIANIFMTIACVFMMVMYTNGSMTLTLCNKNTQFVVDCSTNIFNIMINIKPLM